MPLIDRKDLLLPAFLAVSLLASAPAVAQSASKFEPLAIQDQGSFMVGGTVRQRHRSLVASSRHEEPSIPLDRRLDILIH